jgi:hypothetical protein
MANTVDAPRSQLDNTVRIFDKFYDFDLVIDANQYEIVNSYFESMADSKSIGKNFTVMLFRIASITGESPLTLLEYIKGTSKMHTTALMTYYLNSIKSKTTLYGISVIPSPNETVQRNVVL